MLSDVTPVKQQASGKTVGMLAVSVLPVAPMPTLNNGMIEGMVRTSLPHPRVETPPQVGSQPVA